MKGKRILSLVLAVMLVLGALPAGLSFTAAADGGTDGDIEWQVYGSTLTISGGFMPDYYSSMDTPWYGYDINNVILNCVQSIGSYAFSNMTNLSDVIIPGTVKSIGQNAFAMCQGLRSVTIPEGVTTIGGSAFFNCEYLENIALPKSLTTIESGAFTNCHSMESVTLPRSLTMIDSRAFADCNNLATVNYTGGGADWNKISIADSAFEDTPANRIVRYYGGVQGAINAINDIGANDGSHAYKARVAVAFAAYDRLSAAEQNQVTNADLLTAAKNSLPNHSFDECGVNTAYAWDSLTGELVIGGCGDMKDYDTLKMDFSPWYYNSLSSIVIEPGVTSIGSGAFYASFGNPSVSIPEGLTKIGFRAFSFCESLQNIVLPESLTDIERQAFYGCKSLENITIPDSVKSIGDAAFTGCYSLESITIPDSVKSIGGSAFCDCTSLHTVTIHDSITEIGEAAFANCPKLKTVNFTGSEAQWNAIKKGNYIFDYFDNEAYEYYDRPAEEMPAFNFYYGVEGTINAINDIGTVEHTDACKARIDAARKAYDSLSDYETTQVTNYQTLTDAEAEYARLEAAALPKAIRLGAGVLDANKNTENAATVYYGGYAWRVIGYDGAGTASESGTVTLLAADIEKTTIFSNINNHYSSSELRIEVNKIAGAFTEPEEKAVPFRLLVSVIDPSDPDGIAGVSVRARLWPLSLGEAVDTNDALRSYYRQWWLRSPGDTDNVVGYVMNNGTVAIVGTFRDLYAVRPAFWLDLNKVLFASAAENGKVGDGLTAVGSYTGTDWKLTVLDESRSGFTAKCTNIENGVYTITYSGATTGENEKISAMIVNSDGAATYYGNLGAAKAGENTVTVNVNGKLQSGDKLYVFNEQVNGDKKTDYASALVDVTEKALTKYDLRVGGVQFDENNLKIDANDIPGVTGSATYDPENNELTLDGFQYTGEGYRYLVSPGTQNEHLNTAGIYYDGTDDLTVRLVQENAVTVTGDATSSDAFCSENLRTAVTFTGTGSLTARGADNAQDVSSGITVSGSLCVEKQATVTGVGGDSSVSSYGVLAYVPNTKLEVYGKLTGNGGSASNRSCGVYGMEITVGTDAVLTAAGSAAGSTSEGIVAASVTVRSGTVEAASGKGERYSLAFKAKTGDNIAFDLSDDLTMRAGESKDENEIVTGDGWKNQKYVLIEVFHYKVGDTLQYGTYPQSEVTDAATVAALNAKLRSNGWISYGYYVGTGGSNGEMAPDDFMRYQDVVLDGVKYRAVTFDRYRPGNTRYTSSADNSYQHENGYDPGNTYWFKFEPVTWKVLDPESGLVLCCSAIDAQAYHNYSIEVFGEYFEYWGDADQKYKANDYAHSDIRAWLNEDFINTAFSTAQQENIKVSELDNASTYGGYDYESSADKIFLLSLDEAKNGAYGFDPNGDSADPARQMPPSDYAKCQGIFEGSEKTSSWRLREYKGRSSVHVVSAIGKAGITSGLPSAISGVVPALRMQELQDDPTGAPIKPEPELALEVSTTDPVYGSDVTLTATLPADATGSVIFSLVGSKNTYTFTDSSITDGVAQISQKLNADTYTVTATYSGDGKYDGAEKTITFTVEKAATELAIATSPDTLVYGDAVQITVTLSGGAVFAGDQIDPGTGEPAKAPGSVTITVDGKEYRTISTDPDDVMIVIRDNTATLEVTGLNAGQHAIDAVFVASDNYAGSSQTATFTMEKATVQEPTVIPDLVYNGKLQAGVSYDESLGYTLGVGGLVAATNAGNYGCSFRVDNNHKWANTSEAIYNLNWSIGKATPQITLTAKSLNDAATVYEITVTKPADSTQGVIVYAVYSGLPALALSIRNDKFENGSYTFRFPDVFEDYLSDNVSGEFELSAVYDGRNDQNYQDNIVELTITLGCDHVWKEPEWDWSQDVNNPTYTAECSLCETGKITGTVASTPGTRVEATVEKNAYTPYSASVELSGHTYTGTFELEEPGTMLEARKAAFEQYKTDQKKAAEDKALDGDSDECAALIDAVKNAIDQVTYDESKSLDENKQAVDTAANLPQLEEKLTDQRAADAVEKKINSIGEVAYTDESKDKIDEARKAYDELTDAQKALVDNKDTLEKAEDDYQLLDDKHSFEEYKEELIKAAEDMRTDDDSKETKQLIDDAIAAIDAMEYDESKSLDENKAAVDTAADLDELTEQLEEHREIHYAVFMADGKEVARVPFTIDTKAITAPAVPVKGGYTGAWPGYELKAGGVEINAVYTKNGALVITDNAKEQGEGRALAFMETVTFKTDTSALPEGATLCWYVNGEAVTTEKSVTVEAPKDDYTVQVKAFAKDGTLYTESDVLTVKVDSSLCAKLVCFFRLAFSPVFNAFRKAAPSFFSFLAALIKTVASALVNAVKTVA